MAGLGRLRRIVAIATKNLQVLLKDRRTVALLFFMPILMMILFGYAFGSTVKHVPIKVLNLDQGGEGLPMMNITDTEYSDLAIQELQDDDRVDITILDPSTTNITEEIGQIYGLRGYYGLLVFPENFSEDMLNFSVSMNLSIYVDGSDVQTMASLHSAIVEMVWDVLNGLNEDGPHVQVDLQYVAGDPNLRPVDTMSPGILSFALLLFMILTVTGGFTKERITGMVYRVTTTAATKTDIILGYMLGNSLIALIQSAILLLISVLVFNVYLTGSMFLLFAILFIYALNCVSLGILASAFAQNELQAFQFIPLILIPSMFFSGFLFPLNSFPKIFQYLSYAIPMTYSINMSRAIMINGFGLDMFYRDFFILLGFTGVLIALAILVFRTKK
jgi:ABC-2 type transport system permease protein